MNPFQIPEAVVDRLGWVLVHSAWQFTVVAFVAGIIGRTLRRSSAATRYGLFVAALGVVVAAAATTWMLVPSDAPEYLAVGFDAVPDLTSNVAVDSESGGAQLGGDSMLGDEDDSVPAPGPVVSSDTPSTGAAAPRQASADVHLATGWLQRARTGLRPWLAWIVAGWGVGVAACSGRPLLGSYTLWRLRRVGVSSVSSELLATFRRVSQRLGMRRSVLLLQSTLAQVPLVVGYLRPVILLPVSLITSVPLSQLEAILAHELAHVRRHDFVVNLFQTLVETLFFYHPAVWWLSHQIRVEREHCCDDLVVTRLDNRFEYGRALLAIEELRGQGAVLALGAADGSLLRRVRRILGADSGRAAVRWGDRWPGAAIGLLSVTTLLTLSMTWSFAAKMEAENGANADSQADVAKYPPPKPEDVRGLDLSRVPVRGYSKSPQRSPEQQIPELSVPDPTKPGAWTQPKNVFQMPLAEHTWMLYPTGSGHFYVEHRADGTWQSEQLYGPIDGDPFERLKLDELFRERLVRGANGGDSRCRLRLMFRTGEPELMRRAWRLIEPDLAPSFSPDEQGLFDRLESLVIVRDALRDESAAFNEPGLSDVVARMRQGVAAAEAAIDTLNDSVPDTAYQSVTYRQSSVAAKIPDSLWGQPLDGLRLALVPREWEPGFDWNQLSRDTTLPTSVTVEPGSESLYQLVVENVSDHEIKLSGYVTGEEVARSLEVFDRGGRRVEISGLHTTIPPFRSHWRLKPGERELLSMPAVHFVAESSDNRNQGLGYSVRAVPGQYSLRCSMLFGHLDNGRHRHVPGQSEWIGQLTTGSQQITVPAAMVNTQFFGAQVRGTKFVYVIDRSGSMSQHDRIGAAKRELMASLGTLPPDTQFQVIFYNLEPRALVQPGAVKLHYATDNNRALVARELESLAPDGGTMHLPALKMALAMQPDVVFFLTDAHDLRVHDVQEATTLNHGLTKIHTIEFGIGADEQQENQLRELAKQNGGSYRYIDVAKSIR
jgi:hypothetical protein